MDINNSSPKPSSGDSSNVRLLVGFLWVFSIIVAVVIGFAYGRGSQPVKSDAENKTVLGSTAELSPTPLPVEENILPSSPPSIAPTSAGFCKKAGFAQKWEYLTPYIVKQNDTFQDIATNELHDATRVNEITQINGVTPVVVGSTLYLPPPSVAKSSGNLREVYGMLSSKTSVSWHINFSVDPKGQGILIPSFWFEGIPNSTAYKVGDCVKVFFDDGYKVYSITLQ